MKSEPPQKIEPPATDTATPPAGAALPTLVEMRNFSLVLLAILAVVYTLHWAREVFIPLMLGVMISYALSPLVDLASKWRIPRAISAALFLLGIVGGAGYLIYSLSDEAASLIETLPEAAQKFRQTLNKERNTSDGAIKKVQKAATQIEQAANESAPATPTPSGVTRVQIEKPKINVKEYLLLGTLGAVGVAAQAGIVLFLAYFLLMSGDTFRRKLVKITAPPSVIKKLRYKCWMKSTIKFNATCWSWSSPAPWWA